MNHLQVYPALQAHLSSFFAGHEISYHQWLKGPMSKKMPRFQVARINPGPKFNMWVYATLGSWEADIQHHYAIEFLAVASSPNDRHIEILTINSHYHLKERLGRHHSVFLGEPWLPGGTCDYGYISLPYIFGPDLEICNIQEGHIHYYWLMPITSAEREYKVRQGHEALEQLFERNQVEYWRYDRGSLI